MGITFAHRLSQTSFINLDHRIIFGKETSQVGDIFAFTVFPMGGNPDLRDVVGFPKKQFLRFVIKPE